MNFTEELILGTLALAGEVFHPGNAHAKSTDPIADIIGAKMGWDQPAPRTAPKPALPNMEPIATEDARKAADVAERTAHDFKFALAFSR